MPRCSHQFHPTVLSLTADSFISNQTLQEESPLPPHPLPPHPPRIFPICVLLCTGSNSAIFVIHSNTKSCLCQVTDALLRRAKLYKWCRLWCNRQLHRSGDLFPRPCAKQPPSKTASMPWCLTCSWTRYNLQNDYATAMATFHMHHCICITTRPKKKDSTKHTKHWSQSAVAL